MAKKELTKDILPADSLAEKLKETTKSKKTTSTTEIKFKKLDKDIKLPEYATDLAAGMDIYATGVEYDAEKDNFIYHTSLAGEAKPGIAILGLCRSSNCNTDCYLTNGIGLIDIAEYRGEIKFVFKNRTSVDVYIKNIVNKNWILYTPWYKKLWFNKEKTYRELYNKVSDYVYNNWEERAPYKIGDRIGQFVPIKLDKFIIKEVKTLSESKRGEGGFGSTGK